MFKQKKKSVWYTLKNIINHALVKPHDLCENIFFLSSSTCVSVLLNLWVLIHHHKHRTHKVQNITESSPRCFPHQFWKACLREHMFGPWPLVKITQQKRAETDCNEGIRVVLEISLFVHLVTMLEVTVIMLFYNQSLLIKYKYIIQPLNLRHQLLFSSLLNKKK